MNKKGQIGETFQEFAGTILIALIILLFFGLSLLYGLPSLKTQQIKNDISSKISDFYFIQNNFNTQFSVNYDNKGLKLSGEEISRLASIDENTKLLLKAHNLEISPLFMENSFYIPDLNNGEIYVSRIKTK